jgi:hypothetical protein
MTYPWQRHSQKLGFISNLVFTIEWNIVMRPLTAGFFLESSSSEPLRILQFKRFLNFSKFVKIFAIQGSPL